MANFAMPEDQKDNLPLTGHLMDPDSRGEHGEASEPEENGAIGDEGSNPEGFEEASPQHEAASKSKEGREVIFTPEILLSGGYYTQSMGSSAEVPVKVFVLGKPTPRGWREPYSFDKNLVKVEKRKGKKQDYTTKATQLVSDRELLELKGKAEVVPKWGKLIRALETWCVSSIAWDSTNACFIVTLEPASRTPRKRDQPGKQKGSRKRSKEDPAEGSARKTRRGGRLRFSSPPGDSEDSEDNEADDMGSKGHGGTPQHQAGVVGVSSAQAPIPVATRLPHAKATREEAGSLPQDGSSHRDRGSPPQKRSDLPEARGSLLKGNGSLKRVSLPEARGTSPKEDGSLPQDRVSLPGPGSSLPGGADSLPQVRCDLSEGLQAGDIGAQRMQGNDAAQRVQPAIDGAQRMQVESDAAQRVPAGRSMSQQVQAGSDAAQRVQVGSNGAHRDSREVVPAGTENKEKRLMKEVVRSWEKWKGLVAQKEEADKKVQELEEEANQIESAVSQLQSITRLEEHKQALHEDLAELRQTKLPEARGTAQQLFSEVHMAEKEKKRARKELFEVDQS